jgi:polyisoprenoid-binding protein YceI
MLKGPSFFGSAGGTAVYRSTTIRKVLGNRYKANGTLTLNRKSHPVTLTFDLVTNGDKATVSGSSRLDRTTFGIGSGDWAATDQIAAQVDVTFNFSARRRK